MTAEGVRIARAEDCGWGRRKDGGGLAEPPDDNARFPWQSELGGHGDRTFASMPFARGSRTIIMMEISGFAVTGQSDPLQFSHHPIVGRSSEPVRLPPISTAMGTAAWRTHRARRSTMRTLGRRQELRWQGDRSFDTADRGAWR